MWPSSCFSVVGGPVRAPYSLLTPGNDDAGRLDGGVIDYENNMDCVGENLFLEKHTCQASGLLWVRECSCSLCFL
jgi:hypothetical protein